MGQLVAYEDPQFGGFGAAPKFPMVPVLDFLLAAGHPDALALADRALTAMAASRLRDDVEGGFFRYATRRDWSDPHYERMLYDNAQLLAAYVRLGVRLPERADALAPVIEGIAGYLLTTLRLPAGGFASAQDSESTVDGERVEGGYYKLDATARAAQTPPGPRREGAHRLERVGDRRARPRRLRARPGRLDRCGQERGRPPDRPPPARGGQARARLDRRARCRRPPPPSRITDCWRPACCAWPR